MSTFSGFVSEFPQIRIDQFRKLPGKPAPLACFLSHVHSDHLVGLESVRSPFVYCSAATGQLLLRLEKSPNRMNFSKGILECRKQTYRHLKSLVKTIPLETPTKIELAPGNDIYVTLFDANHCTGAVSFLIEGQGKAVMYTGDVRCEPWWINSLARHPVIVPYSMGLRRLDNIYLDTTFAVTDEPYRDFPSKAEGLRELIEKLAKFSNETVFYFQAWTFGYEDVWLALSRALHSSIHLDRYRFSLYSSLTDHSGTGTECREASAFCGFKCGNVYKPGCLTANADTRVHSCERGTGCKMLDKETEVVTITPIISRHAGVEIEELGVGGGQGDLDQIHELELVDPVAVKELTALCASHIKDDQLMEKITAILSTYLKSDRPKLALDHDFLEAHLLHHESDEVPLASIVDMMKALAIRGQNNRKRKRSTRSITFPYSRHSSYNELRLLVETFKPRGVYPCTAPPAHLWTEEMSMENLFGDVCHNEGGSFAYDEEMRRQRSDRKCGTDNQEFEADTSKNKTNHEKGTGAESETESEEDATTLYASSHSTKRKLDRLKVLQASPRQRLKTRQEAYKAAQIGRWDEVGLHSVAIRREVYDEQEL